MLPSRGLRWSNQAIGAARRRLDLFPSRSFSSTVAPTAPVRSILQLTTNGAPSLRTLSRPQILLATSLLHHGSARRFQSTKPLTSNVQIQSSQIPPASTSPPELATTATQPALDTSFESAVDLSNSSLLDMPEQIGYLKALGLDYGYGPTSVMQWVFEHVHVYCGTPWWATIALTAILVRLVFIKLLHGASDNAARMASVQDVTKPLTKRMTEAQRDGNNEEVVATRRQLQQINRRTGIKIWRSFAPFFQIFTGIGSFIFLRGMTAIPVPALETGGILWFTNLAVPDPFYILPVVTSLIMHVLFRLGGEMGVQSMSAAMKATFMYGLPFISLLFTAFFPAALQFFFLTTTILSAIQSTLFRNPTFRAATGMFPLPKEPITTKLSNPLSERVVTVSKSSSKSSPTSPTYQAPRSTRLEGLVPADAKTTMLAGIKKEVMGAVNSVGEMQTQVIKSAKEYVGSDRKDGKRTRAELKKALDYEKKLQADAKAQKKGLESAKMRHRYGKTR